MAQQNQIKERLSKIVEELKDLEDLEQIFLETKDTPGELRINGNLFDLLTFARSVLQTANGFNGSHQHFDEHNFFDH